MWWQLQPLQQILRRGLRADAFDQTNDADLSSATRMLQQRPTVEEDQNIGGIIPIEPNDQEPSIVLSSPVSLPSPIAAMDAMEAKAKDAPRLDAACQVDDDSFDQEPPPPPSKSNLSPASTTSMGEEFTSTVPSPPSLPASPPPSPPQESLEVIGENEAKEEQGLLGEIETEKVKESVGEENDSKSYSSEVSAASEGESLNETTATGALPPPPANNNDCSEAEEGANDSEDYTGSFDSLSISDSSKN